MHYTLTETELTELETNPALIPARLQAWRRAIEASKQRAARSQDFMRRVTEQSGEVWGH